MLQEWLEVQVVAVFLSKGHIVIPLMLAIHFSAGPWTPGTACGFPGGGEGVVSG